jgi:hypothetical protein
MARGIVAMCLAYSSMPIVTINWFAGEGSPWRAKVEMKPTKGTRALSAMVIAEVFWRKIGEGSRCRDEEEKRMGEAFLKRRGPIFMPKPPKKQSST